MTANTLASLSVSQLKKVITIREKIEKLEKELSQLVGEETEEHAIATISFPPGTLKHLYTRADNQAERRTARASTMKVEPE
ncbi:MAG TPA: hypothetical protein P5186_05100 [Candidatus Paceibacterota bacterium]|mgnify:CR=1 FL=1|nr:hypothetical protein [Verrucomicrobiota bacterium]HRY47405.1 hypothetical protein [Candidatus Paceibacterota bacterium]HSA02473.1 hypothetical protein [Candidatus Paceibacterota bacterium]